MPVPRPKEGESEQEFVARCIGEVASEFPDQSQRAAVCYNAYRDKTKKDIHGVLGKMKLIIKGLRK